MCNSQGRVSLTAAPQCTYIVLSLVILSFYTATGRHTENPAAPLSAFFDPLCSFHVFHPSSHSLSLLCLLTQYFSEADAPALFSNWMPPLADVFVTHQMLFWSLLSIQAVRHASDRQRWSCFKHQSDSNRSTCHKHFCYLTIFKQRNSSPCTVTALPGSRWNCWLDCPTKTVVSDCQLAEWHSCCSPIDHCALKINQKQLLSWIPESV